MKLDIKAAFLPQCLFFTQIHLLLKAFKIEFWRPANVCPPLCDLTAVF